MLKQTSIPQQQSKNTSIFPEAWVCEDSSGSLGDAIDWVSERVIDLAAEASKSGAVLFRGLPIHSPEDFDQFVSAFGFENFEYRKSLSNAVRTNFTERVFSANEAPAEVTIYLHHEMAQTPVFPTKLFFFCQKAADTGGATPLCRSDWLWEAIVDQLPDFANDCQAKGLKYTTVMPSEDDAESGMGRSWQSTFRAQDKASAQQHMQDLRYTWEWLEDGCLKATTSVLPAVHQLPDGRRVFFNQLIAAFKGWKDSRNDPAKAITFGDGAPLDRDTVLMVAEIAESLTFDMQWQSCDVVLIDNYVAMHGRRTFTGTRKVLASLANAHSHTG